MSNWEKNVRKVVPYVPGEQPHEADMIKRRGDQTGSRRGYPPSLSGSDRGRTGAGDRGCLPRKPEAGFCRRRFG